MNLNTCLKMPEDIGDWQSAKWMDGGPTAQLSVWW